MKVVINTCFGGFSVSRKAMEQMGFKWDGYGYPEIERTDPRLVAVVEELGKKASGPTAELRVVEIPDGIEYEIEEYDGYEHIAEVHRTWR